MTGTSETVGNDNEITPASLSIASTIETTSNNNHLTQQPLRIVDENHNFYSNLQIAAAMGNFTSSEYTVPEYMDYEDEIELVVQGKEIVVKESLLVENSKYFSRVLGDLDPEADMVVLKHGLGGSDNEEEVDMMSNSSLEDMEEDSCSDEIEPLTLISYNTMKTLVEYFETGRIKIGESNVKSLLLAADLLVIESVEEVCFNFLKSNLSVSNCVRHWVLAEAKRRSWSRLCLRLLRFIQLHFEQVSKLTQLYQLTDFDQFKRIISDEMLNVEREDRVLETVKDWLDYDWDNRQEYMLQLLDLVQFPLIKEEKSILYAMNDPTFSANEQAVEMLIEAVQYHRMTYEDKVKYWCNRKKPNRWPKMIAALAYADTVIECFDFEMQRWQVLTMKPGTNFGPEMCYLNGMLYTLGGVQAKQVN